MINILGVQHLKSDFYREKANEFYPDRWLQKDTDNSPFKFLAFGAGRGLFGQHLATMEIRKFLVFLLLQHFALKLDDRRSELRTGTVYGPASKE